MKRFILVLIVLCFGFFIASCKSTETTKFTARALNNVDKTSLNKYDYQAYRDIYSDKEFITKFNNFSAKLLTGANDVYEFDSNFSISPMSIYLALSCLIPTVDEETQNDLLDKMGFTLEDIYKTKTLMNMLCYEGNSKDDIRKLLLSNSIWFRDTGNLNKEILDLLASDFYCEAYDADFLNNNEEVNKNIREFVKKNTKGLIDQDFDLGVAVIYAIINTLYLKDNWNNDGFDLKTQDEVFTDSVGIKKIYSFLRGSYNNGQVKKHENYTSFYTKTNAYKISFALPNEGVNVMDIYNDEVLASLTNEEYNLMYDKETMYSTNCIFPSFESNVDCDFVPVLESKMGISQVFLSYYSLLYKDYLRVDKIQHVTKLIVDKTGIEGAAVTVISNKATSAEPYKVKLETYLINRPFIYSVSYCGLPLFMGVCFTAK